MRFRNWLLFGIVACACGRQVETLAVCGEGAIPTGGQCGAFLRCGPGTTARNGVCELDDMQTHTCGKGTQLVAGECVPVSGSDHFVCGDGTKVVGNECLPSGDAPPDKAGAGGTSERPLSCGRGTYESAGECVPLPQAGGTGDGGSSSLVCGTGTYAVGGQCIPVPLGGAAGGGDASTGGSAGRSTGGSAGAIIPGGLTCGAGTHEESGQCVTDTEHFELRVSADQVVADGYSTVQVLAIGTKQNGTPATDTVVIVPSRIGAGQVKPSTVALGSFGTQVSFVPCNAAMNPNCLGPTELKMVRASAVDQLLAAASFELVAPKSLGSPAACLTGGNIYHRDGVQNIVPLTLIDENWLTTPYKDVSGRLFHLSIRVQTVAHSTIYLDFDSSQIEPALGVGVYGDAQRYPFETAGHPGMDTGAIGCNDINGSFQILSLAVQNDRVTEFTATFSQNCDTIGPIVGCIHYAQP